MRTKNGKEKVYSVQGAQHLSDVITRNLASAQDRVVIALSADQLYELCKLIDQAGVLGLRLDVSVQYFDEFGENTVALTPELDNVRIIK